MTGRAGIVWLASYPKSGNTWFRLLLANLSAGDRPADINYLNEQGGLAASRVDFEAETLLESGLLGHDEIDALRPGVYRRIAAGLDRQRWIKAHEAFSYVAGGEPLFGREALCAIYLVRDPRDVAVSLAHHLGAPIDVAVRLLNSPRGGFAQPDGLLAPQLRQKLGTWSDNVTSWLDQTIVPAHLVRYEDLCADPAAQFARALRFAGLGASDEAVLRAVRHADFTELQRQEIEKGFNERQSPDAPFFRSGRPGEWRDRLSAAQVRAIEMNHAEVMRRIGYALESA
jgi:aryl sulfotransferase